MTESLFTQKPSDTLMSVPVELIVRSPNQPRRQFDEIALHELAESIKSNGGLIQPILVRRKGEGYELVAGERRWRACQLAGMDEILCLVRHLSDREAHLATTTENIQREDLNPIEEANAFQSMADEFEMTHQEVAEAVGKGRSYITNALRLLSLGDEIQEYLIKGDLDSGHGKVLVGLKSFQQIALARKAVSNNWSVARLTEAAKESKSLSFAPVTGGELAGKGRGDIRLLEERLSIYLGVPCRMQQKKGRAGQLIISYSDPDVFDGVLEKIGYKK